MPKETCTHCHREIAGTVFNWKGQRVCLRCRSDLEWASRKHAAQPQPVPSTPNTPANTSINASTASLQKGRATMSTLELDTCANCGHTIGKLETPHVWKEQVVCGECIKRLASPASSSTQSLDQQPDHVSQIATQSQEQLSHQYANKQTDRFPFQTVKPANGTGRSVVIIASGVILGVIGLIVIGLFATGIITVTNLKSAHTSGHALNHVDQLFLKALRSGDMSMVKLELQNEPNLKAVDPENGETPLILVIHQLNNKEPLSTYSTDEERKELAEWWDLAASLVKGGADVNGNGKHGQTPLGEADNISTIKFLLDHGAKIDGNAESGTILYWKTSDVWFDQVEFLLSRGANPNVVNFEGQTPLHRAAAENATKIIPLLLKAGAQVNARDNKGYTPLKRARLSFQKEAALMLEQNGGKE